MENEYKVPVAIRRLEQLLDRRGTYMNLDMVMPAQARPAIQIMYGFPFTPLSREDAEYLAVMIRKLPDMIETLTLVNHAFNGGDVDPDMLAEKVTEALVVDL